MGDMMTMLNPSYLLYAVEAAVVGLIGEDQQAARHRQQ
jgi:hypothetical protein